MARTRRNELTAGIFVLACGAAGVAIALWLGGVRFGGRFAHVTAPLAVGDVSVVEGSEVKLSTMVVGKVDRISPAADWRIFTFRIRLTRDVDLRQDAVIEAVAPTLGGVGSLTVLDTGSTGSPPADADHPVKLTVGPNPMVRDIQRQLGYGSTERDTLKAGIANMGRSLDDLAAITGSLRAQLASTDQPNMMSTATETLSVLRTIATDLHDDLTSFRAQLDPANAAGAMGKVHHTLDNASRTSGDAAAMMATIRPNVEQAMAHAASAAETIERYSRTELAELLRTLRAGGNELLAVMSDFRDVSSTARRVVAANDDNVDEMVANLTQVSVNLKAASRDIRRHPWKLLGPPDEVDVRSENIQNAAEAFTQGATQLDDAIQRLKSLKELAGETSATDDPELTLIHQRIRDSFEHFTRVEQALWDEISR
jgi:ABC-type transporter Mla subunit MlaD